MFVRVVNAQLEPRVIIKVTTSALQVTNVSSMGRVCRLITVEVVFERVGLINGLITNLASRLLRVLVYAVLGVFVVYSVMYEFLASDG